METQLFTATKAFIVHGGKVLLLRESTEYKDGVHAGEFDVAGGRIKPGQRFDESLIREVHEETGLSVEIGKPFFVNEWRPVVRGQQWQVVGIFFECFTDSDKVTLSQDHKEYIWINPEDHKKYDIIYTNIPAFEAFISK